MCPLKKEIDKILHTIGHKFRIRKFAKNTNCERYKKLKKFLKEICGNNQFSVN